MSIDRAQLLRLRADVQRAVWSDVCADIDGFVEFITDVLDALEDH